MSYYSHTTSGKYKRYRRYNSDISEALRHIQEAEEFNIRTYGADRIIKNYFFNMTPELREKVFREYGRIYGPERLDYARDTYEKWKTGQVKMSGMVAKRIFDLMPRYLTPEQRMSVVEYIWRKLRRHDSVYFRFSPVVTASDLQKKLQGYLEEHVKTREVPEDLKKEFSWLSSEDTAVYEKLLNRFLDLDRQRILTTVRLTMQKVQQFLRNPDNAVYLQKFEQTVKTDGLEIHLLFDPGVEGVSITSHDPRFRRPSTAEDNYMGWGCLVIIVIVSLLIMSMIGS